MDYNFHFLKFNDFLTKKNASLRNTFPLKMAPWIRVNGSVNRRVLDKYAGTVLLHCIENVGTTLNSLCTRFNYVFPAHIQQLIQVKHQFEKKTFRFYENSTKNPFLLDLFLQYLEEFGCLTLTSLINQEPVTLFSEYKGVELGMCFAHCDCHCFTLPHYLFCTNFSYFS